MTLYVYVDNTKLWTEGKRLKAVKTGLAFDMHDAISRDVTDHSWNCDLGKLIQAVCEPSESVSRSSVFGCSPLKNDSVWRLVEQQGFEVSVSDGNDDVAIATQVMADSYERMQPGDKAVLVVGDRDYLPVIESLRARQLGVVVAFWHHATARELRNSTIEHVSLDELFDDVTS
jgi:uncharacterized LabA/DUF88 family protein